MRAAQIDMGVDARILADTPWNDLPDSSLRKLLAGAAPRYVPARRTILGSVSSGPQVGLLLEGTARAFIAAADGRQLTVRYARRGALLARRSPLLGGSSPVSFEAVTDVGLLDLDAASFLDLVENDAKTARVVLVDLGRRIEDAYATVADAAFGTVRERIARHLLALTGEPGDGDRLIATITQQELADGVGTLREVAARALRELRRDGTIATAPGSIEILDPARLAASLGAWQVAANGGRRHAQHEGLARSLHEGARNGG